MGALGEIVDDVWRKESQVDHLLDAAFVGAGLRGEVTNGGALFDLGVLVAGPCDVAEQSVVNSDWALDDECHLGAAAALS